jgi:hypothetical protein
MSPLSFHSGCDGRNYSNPCVAWSIGVSVSRMGECGVIPEEGGVVVAETSDYCEVGPAANASLGCGTPGQFCQLEMGVCNNEADIHPGVCVETPTMCTFDMNPAW